MKSVCIYLLDWCWLQLMTFTKHLSISHFWFGPLQCFIPRRMAHFFCSISLILSFCFPPCLCTYWVISMTVHTFNLFMKVVGVCISHTMLIPYIWLCDASISGICSILKESAWYWFTFIDFFWYDKTWGVTMYLFVWISFIFLFYAYSSKFYKPLTFNPSPLVQCAMR